MSDNKVLSRPIQYPGLQAIVFCISGLKRLGKHGPFKALISNLNQRLRNST